MNDPAVENTDPGDVWEDEIDIDLEEVDPEDAEEETEPADEPEPPAIPASSNLNAITVAGTAQAPVVNVPAPWAIDRSQNRVLEAADGPLILPGDIVRLNYVGVNGRTGAVFDSSYDRGEPAAFSLTGVVPGFAKGLTGQNVGSRVLMAMPSDDGYGTSGSAGVGIEDGDSLIFLVDILGTSRRSVSGEVAEIPDGLPRVTGDLKPAVTLPNDPRQPSDLQVVTLIEGDGPPVEAGGQLQVNFVEHAWTSTALTFIRQTYGTGSGPVFSYLGGDVVPAWSQALPGVTEGSRVLVVSPPELAYPNGNNAIGVTAGAYSVWVIDVLFA